jgi:hypothetical protein
MGAPRLWRRARLIPDSVPDRDPDDPAARSLVVATVCIIATFIAVGIVSQVHLQRFDRTARQLAAEVAPRIECLTTARGKIHELQRIQATSPERIAGERE